MRLQASDWPLLGSIAAMQVVTAAGVRVCSIRVLRAVAARVGRVIAAVTHADERRVLWAVEATGRRLGPLSTCLVRAIIAEALLNSPARPVQLAIGVRRSAGSLQAHAWVECGGRVLLGETSDRYDRLVEWNGTPQ